jgi:spore coat protein CotH
MRPTSTRPSRIIWILAGAWLAVAPAAWAANATGLFDDSRLHTLELTIHSRDWDDLKAGYRSNDYYPADVAWDDVKVQNAGVRSRGKGSRSPVKPGLELEFDYYAKDQRFVGLRSLVLDNLLTDASMLREATAMALLRRVGVVAPRESFARVFVNGEFVGLYAMVEPVTREFARNGIGAAGTLFEYRWNQPFYETYPGDDLEAYEALFASRNGASGSMESLYGPIRELFRAINETPDVDFMEIARYLDVSSFLKLAAADAFMAEHDGLFGYDGMNNVYLYQVAGGPAHLIPWDKDHAFWNVEASVIASPEHVLAAKMSGSREMMQLYGEALQAVINVAADDGWLDATIGRYYELVREAALADPVKPFDNEVFESAVVDLRAFARSRVAFAIEDANRHRLR